MVSFTSKGIGCSPRVLCRKLWGRAWNVGRVGGGASDELGPIIAPGTLTSYIAAVFLLGLLQLVCLLICHRLLIEL